MENLSNLNSSPRLLLAALQVSQPSSCVHTWTSVNYVQIPPEKDFGCYRGKRGREHGHIEGLLLAPLLFVYCGWVSISDV